MLKLNKLKDLNKPLMIVKDNWEDYNNKIQNSNCLSLLLELKLPMNKILVREIYLLLKKHQEPVNSNYKIQLLQLNNLLNAKMNWINLNRDSINPDNKFKNWLSHHQLCNLNWIKRIKKLSLVKDN